MSQLSGFKFVTTLVLVLTKIESKNKTKYDNFYSSSKAVTVIIIESEIKNVTRIIIQEELQKLTKILPIELILKT